MDGEISLCNPDARRQLCSILFLGLPVRRPGVPCIGYLSNTTGTTSKEPAFRGGWLRSLRHLLEFRRHYREGGAFITERVAPARALVHPVLGAPAQRDNASDVASETRLARVAHEEPWDATRRVIPVQTP